MNSKKKSPLRTNENGDWILPRTSDELQEIIEYVLETADETKAARRAALARAILISPYCSEEEKAAARKWLEQDNATICHFCGQSLSHAASMLPAPTDLNLWRQSHPRPIKTSAEQVKTDDE